jgi:hypothetical protein
MVIVELGNPRKVNREFLAFVGLLELFLQPQFIFGISEANHLASLQNKILGKALVTEFAAGGFEEDIAQARFGNRNIFDNEPFFGC